MRRLTWSEAVMVREKLYVNHVNELQNYNRRIIIRKKNPVICQKAFARIKKK